MAIQWWKECIRHALHLWPWHSQKIYLNSIEAINPCLMPNMQSESLTHQQATADPESMMQPSPMLQRQAPQGMAHRRCTVWPSWAQPPMQGQARCKTCSAATARFLFKQHQCSRAKEEGGLRWREGAGFVSLQQLGLSSLIIERCKSTT